MNRFDDLLLLVEVVDAGSLTAAAERFGMSVSAVSRRLSGLEERLGARLVQRSTRQLALTDVGASFCQRARTILLALEEAERSVGEATSEPSGVLRLAAPVTFGETHLVPLLPQFLARHARLTLDVAFSHRMPRLVDEGVDVAIHIGQLKDSAMVARRLAPLRVAVLASPAYLGRRGTPAAISDLSRHDCLTTVVDGTPQEWEFQRWSVRERVRVSGRIQSTSLAVLKAAAVAGQGLARLPAFMVVDELRQGDLRPVLEPLEVADDAVYAIYPSSRHLAPKVREFVDFLLAAIGHEDYWRRHGFVRDAVGAAVV